MRTLAAVALCIASLGCRTVPLASNAVDDAPGTSLPAVYSIDWWVTLVPDQIWEWQPREPASPAIDPDTDRVVVCTRDGLVRSLSPVDGKVEWEFKTQGPFHAGATIRDGVVYVAGGDGVLYALKARSGELVWKYSAGEELATSPVLAQDKVLVVSFNDTVFAVEQKDGKWVWQYRRDQPSGFSIRGMSTPRVADGVAYVGFSDGYLVALSVADGAMKWERGLSSAGNQFLDVDSTPVLDGHGRLYAASYKDGVYALNQKTGEVEWHTVRAGVVSLTPRGDVLFTAGTGEVSALQMSSGQSLWSLDLIERHKIPPSHDANAGRAPALARNVLAVPTEGSLLFVDPLSGHARANWNPGKGVSATPAVRGSRLYVLSNLGSVFALRLAGAGH